MGASASQKARERSPNFPFITLEAALERARQFHQAEKRGAAPFPAAAQHWKYSPSSSGAIQTVAALKSYGLMVDEGSGSNRRVRLTELALRILLDIRPESAEREQYKRQAATTPFVAAQVYEKFTDGLPSEASLHHHLIFDHGFNQATALRVTRILMENELFKKPYASDTISVEQKIASEAKFNLRSMTSSQSPATQMQSKGGFRQDVLALSEGQIVLQWPEKLTKESFREFKEWIEFQVRKIARISELPTPKKETGDEAGESA